MTNTLQSPLISVIIPLYSNAKFLPDAVHSVLNQTYQSVEIIIIDDQSTDNSFNVALQLAEQYDNITVLQNAQNSGAAMTRNYGIQKSSGRFICFLDADDFWDVTKLEKQLHFMLSSGYAFTFTSYAFTNETGELTTEAVTIPAKINYTQSLKNHTIWTSTVMLDLQQLSKSDILMPNVRRGQDTATWWQILKKVNYAYSLPEALAFYRRTNDSLSANKFKAMQRTWYLFTKIEKLPLHQAVYNFCWYAFNAVKRRL